MQVTLAGIAIDAVSIGGVETCFQVPSFDVCLDIGRCPPGAEKRSNLLLTHGHIDHAAGLPYYISMRALMKASPPRIFCPPRAIEPIQKMLSAWSELQADTERCALLPAAPGTDLPIKGDLYARAFHAPHRIACTGYSLFKKVRKLKPELTGLPAQEIAARHARGEAINDLIERHELCFPGDTRIEVVERERCVREARVLLLECTFIGPEVAPEVAQGGGHIHLDDIAARAELFENEAILLTHFSRRHRPEEIRAAVAQRLPAKLRDRVSLLLED
jgi:ribonuclease Z